MLNEETILKDITMDVSIAYSERGKRKLPITKARKRWNAMKGIHLGCAYAEMNSNMGRTNRFALVDDCIEYLRLIGYDVYEEKSDCDTLTDKDLEFLNTKLASMKQNAFESQRRGKNDVSGFIADIIAIVNLHDYKAVLKGVQ